MLGTDMAKVWQGNNALLDLIRDREVLQHVLADVAGEGVANASEGATGKVKRTIIRDCLNGENGRAKVEGWVPKWMAFPPSCLHRARWGRDRQPGGQGRRTGSFERTRAAASRSLTFWRPPRRQTSPSLLEGIMTDDPDPVTLTRMERAVRKLPRLRREIFLAARLDDMNYVEIAERTGLSVGQVERELARALMSVARCMKL